jgi:hypothetical protein
VGAGVGGRGLWAAAVAAALVGLVAVAGCGGKGKPPAPKPGQAALLGTYDGDTTVGQVLVTGHPNGAATDGAGTTYVLNSPSVIGLSTTGKGTAFPTTESLFDATPPEGLVAMPDGSVLFGHGAEVVRLDPKSGDTSVLAGNADRTRPFNASAPATDLTTTWLASDGADGLYFHAVQLTHGSGDYVLHLHDGTATLVLSAKPTASDARSGTCDVHDPVDATRFPCALPRTLTYHAGQLVLAGEKSYVVRLPASQG